MRTLLTLFRETFLLSASALGGGYVILTAADDRFSRRFGWIRPGELFEMLPVFQMIPGIIGGHTAVYLGSRVAGLPGAAAALAGMVLPSVLVFLAISLTYRSIPVDAPLLAGAFLGLRAAVAGVMADAVLRTWRTSVRGPYGLAAFATALAALLLADLSPALVVAGGLLAGLVREAVRTHLAQRPPDGAPRVFRSFAAIPLVFLGYGLIAFGGGFVLVPVFLRDFVGNAAPYLQLPPADFANVLALTGLTPGPLAANCATFFGHAMGGVAGALVATTALVLPGSVLLLLALRSLDRFRESPVVRGLFFGVRPVTAALLVSATWSYAGLSIWQRTAAGHAFSPTAAVLAVLTLLAVRTHRLGAVPAILLSALLAAAVPCVQSIR